MRIDNESAMKRRESAIMVPKTTNPLTHSSDRRRATNVAASSSRRRRREGKPCLGDRELEMKFALVLYFSMRLNLIGSINGFQPLVEGQSSVAISSRPRVNKRGPVCASIRRVCVSFLLLLKFNVTDDWFQSNEY
jgi:hypothetical protein